MKKPVVVIITLLLTSSVYGQNADIKVMVDSLPFIKSDTLDCSAALYWKIIAQGEKAIPFLIDKLTDTTQTLVRFHCKQTTLNAGEVAQFALTEIAFLPEFYITKVQFDFIGVDKTGQGCWSFYDFLFINSNKSFYQTKIREWYAREKGKFRMQYIAEKHKTSCQRLYGIDKYYNWVR